MKKIKFKDTESYSFNSLIQLLAKVDPEYLKGLSGILNRELIESESKDTENYNTDVISQRVDAGISFLMEGGLTHTQSLDLVKLLNDHIRYNGKSSKDYERLFDAIANKDYAKAPFTQLIEADLRANFILKTEDTDTFDSLFAELDANIIDYMDKAEWEFIKSKIPLAQKRIRNEDMLFPDPAPGSEKGLLRDPSEEEKIMLELSPDDSTFKLDVRKDNDDLLALKELVNLVKGKKAHPLTIGPGFFLKYLPEIIDQTTDMGETYWRFHNDRHAMAKRAKEYQADMSKQWDGIVFKFDKDNELVKIKLYKLPYLHTDHGTLLASLGLIYSQNYTNIDKKYEIRISDVDKTPMLLERYNADRVANQDMFIDGSRYMILTHSYISAPENKSPLGYKGISKNNQILRAAECYLFEEVGQQILNTRLYFYPYHPSKINPMLQHGSVIFGTNDQSFHTCSSPYLYLDDNDPNKIDPEYRNLLMDYWKHLGNDFSFDSNTLAGKLSEVLNPDGSPNENVVPTELLKREYEKVLLNIIHGTYDFSPLAMKFATVDAIDQFSSPHYFTDRDLIFKLQAHALPFSQRFAIWDYEVDSKGISLNAMPTFLKSLAKVGLTNGNIKSYLSVIQAQELSRLIKNGMPSKEAYFRIYGAKK